MSWTNEDGLIVDFNTEAGQVVPTGTGNPDVQTLEVILDSADLPTLADINQRVAHLPANALVVDAFLVANEAWTGTSPTLAIGLGNSEGGVILSNGVDTAIAMDTEQAAAGDVVACNGSLVNKTSTIGSVAGWVYTTPGGTITGGKSTLYVRYFVPQV